MQVSGPSEAPGMVDDTIKYLSSAQELTNESIPFFEQVLAVRVSIEDTMLTYKATNSTQSTTQGLDQ